MKSTRSRRLAANRRRRLLRGYAPVDVPRDPEQRGDREWRGAEFGRDSERPARRCRRASNSDCRLGRASGQAQRPQRQHRGWRPLPVPRDGCVHRLRLGSAQCLVCPSPRSWNPPGCGLIRGAGHRTFVQSLAPSPCGLLPSPPIMSLSRANLRTRHPAERNFDGSPATRRITRRHVPRASARRRRRRGTVSATA